MELRNLLKTSLLVGAFVGGVAVPVAQAVYPKPGQSNDIDDSLLLGTQPQAEGDKEIAGDDLKLSPYLYRLKERVKKQRAEPAGESGRASDDVLETRRINVDIIIDDSLENVRAQLAGAGLTVNAAYGNSVGGTIAAGDLEALSHVPAVKRINMPLRTTNERPR